jgi:uncharacterized protein YegL
MSKIFTEIVCIIDRSGSMYAIKDDAIGGFNTFLKTQKELPGEATLTLVQFDTEYEMVHENSPLQDVPELNDSTFSPRGMTALHDAIGRTIDTVGKRLKNMPDENRPAKVIVSILTDGEENSSREFNLSTIKEMIEHQRSKYSWEFIFLGANQDAFAEAGKIGINIHDTVNFAATGAGIRSAYTHTSGTIAEYRTK